jgi:hypothetical protein
VHATVAENKGEGVRVGTRCMWDAVTDNMASETFHNVRFRWWRAGAGEASARHLAVMERVRPRPAVLVSSTTPCSCPPSLVSSPRRAGQPGGGVHRLRHLPVLSAGAFAAAATRCL